MRTFWENDGEPLTTGEHAGDCAATIDFEDHSPVQRFYGKTHKEVADKLLSAQANASQRIRELKAEQVRNSPPDLAEPETAYNPRPLTADERHRVARDITNPATAPEAIQTVVEAAVGAPLADVSRNLNEDQEEERARRAREEAIEFAKATPDYFASPHNVTSLLNYMRINSYAMTRRNFAIAWEALKEAGLAQFAPNTEPAPASGAQPASLEGDASLPPATRPRLAATATALRSADASGGGRPPAQAAKYTIAQIEAMSQTDYDYKFHNEPGFREFVDRLYSQPAPARR